MKFSVLLPTRNRLEYLRFVIESVQRQDYLDWEIIVSDNCSEEDISGYLLLLGDSRIKYYRTESFVPVTDNWNNALVKSSGEYVIMLGDDDCLMTGYFSTFQRLIQEYRHPDFIYTNAFLYAYPGVMPESPTGYLQPYGYAVFFKSAKEPFWLDHRHASRLARQSMNFRANFGFNMQFFVISRKLIDSLQDKGNFFQPPYPDFYAANVMFLKAERILICPYPLVTIGICPKSYGAFYYNKREQEGVKFLKNKIDPENAARLERVLLPGSDMITSWLLAMEAVKSNYSSEFDLHVNYQRYRFLQIRYVYRDYYLHKTSSIAELKQLQSRMRVGEKIVYGSGFQIAFRLLNLVPQTQRERLIKKIKLILRPNKQKKFQRIEGRYKNIIEVLEHVDPVPQLQRLG